MSSVSVLEQLVVDDDDDARGMEKYKSGAIVVNTASRLEWSVLVLVLVLELELLIILLVISRIMFCRPNNVAVTMVDQR